MIDSDDANNYSIRDENIDFDEKMKTLSNELTELLKAEEKSKKDLLDVFKTLGYGIG